VSALETGLDPQRFDHRLLVGTVEPDEADYLELRAPEVSVERVPGLGRSVRPTDDLVAMRHVTRAIREFRPHIVHTHTAKAGVIGRIAAIERRVPARVHTFHGHLLHGYFSPTKTRAVVTVERSLARRTTTLAAVGARVRDDLLAARIGRPDQFVVVPPGVPEPRVVPRAAARAELGLPSDAPVVAFVARMTAVKRPDRFAEVARRVASVQPDTHFAIAGAGALLDDLRERCEPLGARAHFLGWQADVGAVYSAADVVVLTSDNEGMPVSLIEAAMCERPAVTTDVGSASEVVAHDETGFVTSLDTESIAEAVGHLVASPDLAAKMGDAAGARARAQFSTTRLVAATAAIYENIARERGF
jgi:glycosyltransferase involved in cell wall biosynthesis